MADIPDLTGEWVGHYQGHFDEFVRITQAGAWATATKLTGDAYVPAGEVTWRADVRTGAGEGQIAEEGFRAARFLPGRLQLLGPERIRFEWLGLGAVEYRRDD
jgi:hypothetical protein